MVQQIRDAITDLERARTILYGKGEDTRLLDSDIRELQGYAKELSVKYGEADQTLSKVVLHATQQRSYRVNPSDRALRAVLNVNDPNEVNPILESYVQQGILEHHSYKSRNSKTGVIETYRLTPRGYAISLEELRKRAEEDKRAPKDISITEIGLPVNRKNLLLRARIQNVEQLIRAIESYELHRVRMMSPSALSEILEKTEFYRKRTLQNNKNKS